MAEQVFLMTSACGCKCLVRYQDVSPYKFEYCDAVTHQTILRERAKKQLPHLSGAELEILIAQKISQAKPYKCKAHQHFTDENQYELLTKENAKKAAQFLNPTP